MRARARVFRRAGCCLAGLLVAASAGALGKPDWAEPYLDRPTPAGGYIAKNDVWVVVYGEVEFAARGPRSIEERCRLLIENVSGTPQSFDLEFVYDEGQQELSDVELHVQRRLWHRINLEKKAVTASVPGAERYLYASAEKIEPGKRVVFQYTLGDKLGFNPWFAVTVPREMPVAEVRYSVTGPARAAGAVLRLITPDGSGAAPGFESVGDQQWSVTRVPAGERIRTRNFLYQPVDTDLFPFFLVSAGCEDADAFAAYAAHYRVAWDERVAAIDRAQVEAKAAELAAGATAWQDRAAAVTRFVQQDIHYDDSNLKSIESWLPLSTQEVLRSGKADCKAKTMMLQALMTASGLTAVPVLVRSEASYYTWREQVGTAFFNHVILAVKPPTGAEPVRSTLLEGPLAGWVLVDPTAETAGFGRPLPGYEGTPALAIVAADAPVFTVHTTQSSAARSRIEVDWTLRADGSAAAKLRATDNGNSTLVWRLLSAARGEDRVRTVLEAFSDRLPDVGVSTCEARRPAAGLDRAAQVEIALEARKSTQELSSSVLAESPLGVAAQIAGLPKGYRAASRPKPDDVVELAPPWDAKRNCSGTDVEVEIEIALQLPDGLSWDVPAARVEQKPWLEYSCSWERIGPNRFRGIVGYHVPRGEWPVDERAERLKTMDELLTSLYAPLLLARSAGGAAAP